MVYWLEMFPLTRRENFHLPPTGSGETVCVCVTCQVGTGGFPPPLFFSYPERERAPPVPAEEEEIFHVYMRRGRKREKDPCN